MTAVSIFSLAVALDPIVAQESTDGGNALGFLLPLIILGGLFYVLLILPQRRRQKKMEQMRADVGIGDEIRTIGGIIGTVVAEDDDVDFKPEVVPKSKQEVERIRTEEVSDQELATAKASFVDVFPRRFESAEDIVSIFADDEYVGRPHDYWKTYRDRISAVTKKDVQRVAKKYLQPDKLVYLIVGKWSDIEPGDADGRAAMKQFAGGSSNELPIRDPLTLKPM